jgi:predicted nucleic acid-binding protein
LDKAVAIEIWINEIPQMFKVLPMDTACFREFARLMQRRPLEQFEDVMIAAIARIHGLIIATRNERDFQGMGVEIFNPFKMARPPSVQ